MLVVTTSRLAFAYAIGNRNREVGGEFGRDGTIACYCSLDEGEQEADATHDADAKKETAETNAAPAAEDGKAVEVETDKAAEEEAKANEEADKQESDKSLTQVAEKEFSFTPSKDSEQLIVLFMVFPF